MIANPRNLLPLFLVTVLVVLAAGGCAPARLGEAARVLADIDAGDRPSSLKAETPTPIRRPVEYRVVDRLRSGDLYDPGAGQAARAADGTGARRLAGRQG